MQCPKCFNNMEKKSLQEAIHKEEVEYISNIDVYQTEANQLLAEYEYAVCPKCGFKMFPPKSRNT